MLSVFTSRPFLRLRARPSLASGLASYLLLIVAHATTFAEDSLTADDVIARMRAKTDLVSGFTADVKLTLDIDFIEMPQKVAKLTYQVPDTMDFDSDDFIVIPKRGLDLSYSNVFETEYTAILQGTETIDTTECHVVKVIPRGRSRLAIATLHVDTSSYQTKQAEIVTKNNGTFVMQMTYDQTAINLPSILEISFEMEKFKLPLRYLGKNATLDKKKLKSQETKRGKIILQFSDYDIALTNP